MSLDEKHWVLLPHQVPWAQGVAFSNVRATCSYKSTTIGSPPLRQLVSARPPPYEKPVSWVPLPPVVQKLCRLCRPSKQRNDISEGLPCTAHPTKTLPALRKPPRRLPQASRVPRDPVVCQNSAASCDPPMIVAQQTAKALAAFDRGVPLANIPPVTAPKKKCCNRFLAAGEWQVLRSSLPACPGVVVRIWATRSSPETSSTA
jgi:hypothetical protein